jgi:nitroreductase
MDAISCIKGRASVRKFRKDPIEDIVLEELLEAAVSAPSSGNLQNWEFVVVSRQENKDRLAEATMGQGFLSQAPLVVVVCSNLKKMGRYGSRGETLYSIQNTAAATQNLMLAAWDRGIGSCWIGAFSESDVREALVLPEHVKPLAMIALGYPAEEPVKPERWPLKDFVHRERF